MNDIQKTLAFVVTAVVALGAAWIGRPGEIGEDTSDQVGAVLFPELNDPLAARSMEIQEFLPATGEVRDFKVEQKRGLWVLPSHQDYPADAEDNLKDAATALVDLKVINVASEKKSDHKTFGVVRPNADDASIGDEGIGKLVTLKDEQGKTLAEIVIGKEVQGQEGQRYVRAGKLDQVLVVEIDPSKMSTDFADWVDRDVLDLNGFDIQTLTVQDYSISDSFNMMTGELRLTEEPRLEMSVEYKDGEWQLRSLEEFRAGEMRPTELLSGEELNADALNTMKNTLDELKIVDVEAKPAGLVAGEVTSDGAWKDAAGIRTLLDNGFYPTQTEDGGIKIQSSDGQVRCGTKDGVVYTLWFGQDAGIEESSEDNSLNRYVMIQASVDESAFDKPVLELTEAERALSAPAEETSEPESADELESAEEAAEGDSDDTDSAAPDSAAPDSADPADDSGEDEADADVASSDTEPSDAEQF